MWNSKFYFLGSHIVYYALCVFVLKKKKKKKGGPFDLIYKPIYTNDEEENDECTLILAVPKDRISDLYKNTYQCKNFHYEKNFNRNFYTSVCYLRWRGKENEYNSFDSVSPNVYKLVHNCKVKYIFNQNNLKSVFFCWFILLELLLSVGSEFRY